MGRCDLQRVEGLLDLEYRGTNQDRPLSNRVDLEVANLREVTAVVVKYHYLHRGRTMAQLPYWVMLDNHRVGVLLFALPRLSVTFCGYGPMELLELARMWFVPSLQGRQVVDTKGRTHAFSLASCAIGKALKRCRRDWSSKYPHLPAIRAIISWADLEYHHGTVYKAANFTLVGVSGGSRHGTSSRKNGGHDQPNLDYLHKKLTYLYPFVQSASLR